MTRFVFIRHGQSEGNLHNLFVGRTSSVPLTALGRRQAMLSRDFLKNERFDLAVSSPLLRAYETGSIVLGDRPLPLIPVDGLMEIDGGEWECMRFEDLPIKYPAMYDTWRNDFGHACPTGGEAVADLGARVVREVLRLAREYPDRNVLAASHATPIRMLRVFSLGIPFERAGEIAWPSNASVSIFRVEGDRITSEAYDLSEHMGDCGTRLSKLI